MADQQFLDALHEQDKIDQLVVDLDLAQYDNVVLSVNNKTGAVVLVTTDIAEGTNLYYTNARADERVALLIDDTLTNLTKAWSSQKITDAISAGVVASAAKWTTPMDLTFSGDLVGVGSFDGSTPITISVTVPGKVDNGRVLTDVPAGALFTDTVYDDTTIWAAVNLNTAKTGITASQAQAIEDNTTGLAGHTGNTANPHYVTKAQVGLGNVTNDACLPIAGGVMTGLLTASQMPLVADKNNSPIIESGAGYIKYADGTMICYGRNITLAYIGSVENMFGTTSGSMEKRGDHIDFAATFSSLPTIIATAENTGIIVSSINPSTTRAFINLVYTSGMAFEDTAFDYMAIGKW